MFKKLMLSALVATFAVSAAALEKSSTISYSRDDEGNVYIHEPLRVTFDADQRAALQDAITLISAQLKQLQTLRSQDPNGDLKSINASIDGLNTKLDLLTTVAAKLYTQITPFGVKLFQALPSALIVFGGANADKNLFKFVQVGGSIVGAAVLVPEKITKISAKTQKVETRIDWTSNSSLVLMGLGLLGAQATPTAVVPGFGNSPMTAANKNGRGGIGFVWGDLNKASELTGLAYGGTLTVNLGAGVNGKFLALKNTDKEGAANNYILLLGVQRSAALADKIPWTNIDAEFGANVGVFVDAGSAVMGASGFAKDIGALISGKRGQEANK